MSPEELRARLLATIRSCDDSQTDKAAVYLDVATAALAHTDVQANQITKFLTPVEAMDTAQLIEWNRALTKLLDEPEEERGGIGFVLSVGNHLEKFVRSWNSSIIQEKDKQITILKAALISEKAMSLHWYRTAKEGEKRDWEEYSGEEQESRLWYAEYSLAHVMPDIFGEDKK
jgi:hypothetical protein